ncbi:MAG: hypothetical protein ACTSXP_00805 [Promethearchaeota archaeon]
MNLTLRSENRNKGCKSKVKHASTRSIRNPGLKQGKITVYDFRIGKTLPDGGTKKGKKKAGQDKATVAKNYFLSRKIFTIVLFGLSLSIFFVMLFYPIVEAVEFQFIANSTDYTRNVEGYFGILYNSPSYTISDIFRGTVSWGTFPDYLFVPATLIGHAVILFSIASLISFLGLAEKKRHSLAGGFNGLFVFVFIISLGGWIAAIVQEMILYGYYNTSSGGSVSVVYSPASMPALFLSLAGMIFVGATRRGPWIHPPPTWDCVMKLKTKRRKHFIMAYACLVLQSQFGQVSIPFLASMFQLPTLKVRVILRNWKLNRFSLSIRQNLNVYTFKGINIPSLFEPENIPDSVRIDVTNRINVVSMGGRILPQLPKSLVPDPRVYGAVQALPAPAYAMPMAGGGMAPAAATAVAGPGVQQQVMYFVREPVPKNSLDELEGLIVSNREFDLNKISTTLKLDPGALRLAIVDLIAAGKITGQFDSSSKYKLNSDPAASFSELRNITRVAVQPAETRPSSTGTPPSAESLFKPSDDELLNKLNQMFKASRRIKIDDICQIVNLSRSEILRKLLEFSDKFGLKIDGEYIILESDTDFASLLDKEFDSWSIKEETKEGKLPDLDAEIKGTKEGIERK